MENYKTRVVIKTGKALTRNPSLKLSSRACSIDKKIKNEKKQLNNT